MSGSLSCSHALRLLGHRDSRVLDAVGALSGAGGEALGVPGLGALTTMLISHGADAVRHIRERMAGLNRIDRTQRIAAAHAIIVVASYFEALDDLLAEEADGPRLRDLDLSGAEQVALATSGRLPDGYGDIVACLLESPVPLPSAHLPYEDNLSRVEALYDDMAVDLMAYLDHPERGGGADDAAVRTVLALAAPPNGARLRDTAVERYATAFRELTTTIPEFAVWAGMLEHQATRHAVGTAAEEVGARLDAIGTGLDGLGMLLDAIASDAAPDQRRAELAARYRAVLDQPVLRTADAPSGLVMPRLADAYIDPRGRITAVWPESDPSSDSWWADIPVHEDLPRALAGLLTSPEALDAPLVVLGHPGAGKSKLTEILAARLPGADFLTVRVELRRVPPDAPVQDQIEAAVRDAIGERLSWPELARSAKGAVPVVMLDGFDELVQATGVNRSDYLEQVRDFQRREAELGRPVAVLVTSRTVVADRMRFPTGTVAVRLEPLSDAQIGRMLDVWAAHNARGLAARGLTPPPADTLLAHRDLAEQPLLLILLLLFDADTNALQHHESELGRSGLYEQLLIRFARREVEKHGAHLDERDTVQAAEDELRRLEVVAMAMFARHAQTVDRDDLERDLSALFPSGGSAPGTDAGLHGAVGDAEQLLGRFFFIHESQARQDDRTRSVYEFLHATFSEYLVARLVAAALKEVAEERRHAASRRRFSQPLDDGLLYAVLSFAVLAGRAPVVEFLDDQLARHLEAHPGDRAEFRAMLTDLLAEAGYPQPHRSLADYEPVRLSSSAREAHYTANLVHLLVLVAEEPIRLDELLPHAADAHWEWRRITGMWRALSDDEWFGMVDGIRARHLDFDGGAGYTLIEREDRSPINFGECVAFELPRPPVSTIDPYAVSIPFSGVTSRLIRSTALRIHGTSARQFLITAPYVANVSADVFTWYVDDTDNGAWCELHDILHLRTSLPDQDWAARVHSYLRIFGETPLLGRLELMMLRQAAEDFTLLADAQRRTELAKVVDGYLARVREVVPGPRLGIDFVEPVLGALEPHIGRPDRLDVIRTMIPDEEPADTTP